MRNVWQYPVTADEVLLYLDGLMKEESKRIEEKCVCGSMIPLYLKELTKLVKENRDKIGTVI